MLHGVGLVAAGVFSTDPSDGFPVGTPDGLPGTLSWHAQAHNVVSMTAFAAALVACLVLAGPTGRAYGGSWRYASLLVPVGVVAIMAAPLPLGMSLRLAVGSALILGWITALSLRALSHR